MDEKDLREQALERLHQKRAFIASMGTYAFVSVFMVAIWALTGAGFFWPIFPIIGMAFAAAGTWWKTYGQKPISEAQVQEEMRRLSDEG